MPKDVIKLSNTPRFYLEYTKNWLAHEQKKKNPNPAELAIIADIATLIEIAVGVMEPVPTENKQS